MTSKVRSHIQRKDIEASEKLYFTSIGFFLLVCVCELKAIKQKTFQRIEPQKVVNFLSFIFWW